MTFAEARAFYGLPPAERDPHPVLPAASRDIASQFVGMRIGTDRKPMPDMAAPASEIMEEAETAQQVVIALSPQDVRVLDLAVTVANFREVSQDHRLGLVLSVDRARRLLALHCDLEALCHDVRLRRHGDARPGTRGLRP